MNHLNSFDNFNKNSPIGIFDSGYGGLVILNKLQSSFPDIDFIYLGDNLRAPYGNLPDNKVIEYSTQAIEYLFSLGCCKVILACNTASSKKELLKNNIIGIIEPTIKKLNNITNNKHIGILATKNTIDSNVYKSLDGVVNQQACPLWVSLIENGLYKTPSGLEIINKDLKSLLDKDSEIDTILLGCTHFNLISDIIQSIVGDINIVSQDDVLIDYVRDIKCSKNGYTKYLTTQNSKEFDIESNELLNRNIKSETIYL
jgi:glutamate racemase